MSIKINKPNPEDYLCRFPDCHYITGASDPLRDIINHISEKHNPADLGEKKGRFFKLVDKVLIWRSK